MFRALLRDFDLLMMELNPERDVLGDNTVNPTFKGSDIGGLVVPVDGQPTEFVGEGFVYSTAAEVTNGAHSPNGNSLNVVNHLDTALTSFTAFDLPRGSTDRVDVSFVVRVRAAQAADTFHGIGDIDGTSAAATNDDWAVMTEAQLKTYVKALRVGGEAPSSVEIASVGTTKWCATAYFTFSTTGSTVSLSSSAGITGGSATSLIFLNITPVMYTPRGSAPSIGYDENGNPVTGRRLKELLGSVHFAGLRGSAVSDSTERQLRLLGAVNRTILDGNGATEAFTAVMDNITDRDFSITVDSDFWFSLDRIFSNDSSLSDAQLQKAYIKWYRLLPVFKSVVLTDEDVAEAFANSTNLTSAL
jgi:hypothetical protein